MLDEALDALGEVGHGERRGPAAPALRDDRGQPLDRSGKVVRGAQRTVTDGPFIEVKDMVAGFIVVRACDVDEAAALAAGCPMLEGGGSVEVRPVLHL